MINNIISNYSNTFDIFSKIIILKLFYSSFIIFILYNLPLIFAYKILNKGTPFFLKKTLYNLFNTFYLAKQAAKLKLKENTEETIHPTLSFQF